MRRIIRWLIALIIGLIAFEAVVLWPVRPMWMRPVEASCRILGFDAQQGSILLFVDSSPKQDQSSMHVAVRDVETGEETRRLRLPLEKDCRFGILLPLPGMCHLFVISMHFDPTNAPRLDEDGRPVPSRRTCRILDLQSGAVVNGPLSVGNIDGVIFSHDGRWFWSFDMDRAWDWA